MATQKSTPPVIDYQSVKVKKPIRRQQRRRYRGPSSSLEESIGPTLFALLVFAVFPICCLTMNESTRPPTEEEKTQAERGRMYSRKEVDRPEPLPEHPQPAPRVPRMIDVSVVSPRSIPDRK